MDEPPLVSSDPETSIAIPEKLIGINLKVLEQRILIDHAMDWIWFGFVTSELPESCAAEANEQTSITSLAHVTNPHPRRRIVYSRLGFPSPKPRLCAGPERACGILTQAPHERAEDAVVSVALRTAVSDCAQPARRSTRRIE